MVFNLIGTPLKKSIILLVIIILFLVIINPYINLRFYLQQRELAHTLGIKIWDYPYTYSFPVGYFYSVLKPGMTITEVHSFVKGYKSVTHCDKSEIFMSETYKYFSVEEGKLLRFKLFYDGNGIFETMMTEDPDSMNLGNGCTAGPLKIDY